jgi:hypothetical protein
MSAQVPGVDATILDAICGTNIPKMAASAIKEMFRIRNIYPHPDREKAVARPSRGQGFWRAAPAVLSPSPACAGLTKNMPGINSLIDPTYPNMIQFYQ